MSYANAWRVGGVVVLVALGMASTQALKWQKLNKGKVIAAYTDTEVPISELVTPQPGKVVYKRVKEELVYKQSTFPFIKVTHIPKGVEYYTKEE